MISSVRSGGRDSSASKPLLPVTSSGLPFHSPSPPHRSVLRMREKYILILTIITFVIFCVGGFFFLPELKAGTSIAYKQIKDAGPDLLGLIPPVDHGPRGENSQYNANIPAPDLLPYIRPTARAKQSDMQILANKIKEEMRIINMSQNAAVIPPPRGFRGMDTDRESSSHNINNGQWHNGVLPQPNVDLNSEASEHLPVILPSGEPDDEETAHRRSVVKSMMRHAWDNYVTYAWGENELRPISKKGHSPGIFGRTKLGASIIDAMDTLLIMGLREEFNSSREWVAENLSLEDVNADISVFEFNIRFIGGMLTCYALTKDPMFKEKAKYFADKLLPAFDTPTGVPHALINPRTGHSKNYAWASASASILAEFGSLHLEFVYLSEITGNPIYSEKVFKIRNLLHKMSKPNGLYPNYLNPKTGNWGQHHISMGALGDSFYEYLLKSWLQSGKVDSTARVMYDEAIEAIERHLIQTSSQNHLTYVAEMKYDRTEHKMDHLACFAGGLFALGSQTSATIETKNRHLAIGAGLTNTCHESYIRTETRIGPESFRFTENVEAKASRMNEKYYILRPEVVESYFYLWRITKDQKYRDWAWDVVQALEKHCRVDGGYTGLKNVYDVNSPKDDVQQSFLFAELFKYLYLIFSNDDLINLNQWVFNTEAHPLPIKTMVK